MYKNKYETGQSLVIIAISFLALTAVAALIIDGGSLYLNRRNAQTAVDAAALAGARELCVKKSSNTAIQTIVNQYAVTENGATTVENVTIDRTAKSVTVRAMLQTSSFFARVLGYTKDTVRAEASSGCFSPRTTKNLLPVAWSCQPPVGGSVDSCSIHAIPWVAFQTLLTVHDFGPGTNANMLLDEDTNGDETYGRYRDGNGTKMTYLIMDDDKFAYSSCKPPIGTTVDGLNCDFNNDGIVDVEAGADRGWLILGTKGGADALKDIIKTGYPDPIVIPQWFTGQSGVAAAVYDAAATVIKLPDPVLVPVFNAICPDTTSSGIPTKCPTLYQAGDQAYEYNGNKKGAYYRVAGFAPFVVTCVSKNNSDNCPGKDFVGLKNNTKTIEGYFVSGYTGGGNIDPDGFDLGIYVISLTK
jgi:Flp pilus assembly protein TadG